MPDFNTFLDKQIALRALFFVIFLLLLSFQAVPAQTGIVAGLKTIKSDKFIHLGIMNKISDRISVYSSAETSNIEFDISPQILVTFPLSKSIILGFLLGPEIQIYNENPTDGEVLTYLSAATGITFCVHLTKDLSVVTSYDYTQNESLENNSRFGIGAVFWLPYKE